MGIEQYGWLNSNMEKIAVFFIVLFLSNMANAEEKYCRLNNYDCFIDKARNEVSGGDREKGLDILNSITGPSISSRKILGIFLRAEGDDPITIERSRLLLESAFREGDLDAGGALVWFYYGSLLDRSVFPENEERAIYILKKILSEKKNGSGETECLLGELLKKHNREDEAIYWLEKAANRGYLFAGRRLVPIFSSGKNKDLVKAWFYGTMGGSSMANERREIEKQMTLEQLEQAQQMSWDWQDDHHIRLPGYRGQGSPIIWQVE
ncbi:hypothetical protein [Zymobacter palmae]|uniref:hypothetical protein n=1 Tax=Zymobacter palmae TaxID=33074 RepID=UPI0004828608|nr:hypothetical protein [Zymobacter palmae]